MLSRPAFSIRKLMPSPQKKHDGPDDYEGSYFYHDDDEEMDTLSRIKTWRPPMGLMKRSKPSIDIRRSEDLHRIICIPPLPDTPQSSTTSLCSIDNGAAYAVNASPRASPPRRPDRGPLASPLMSPERSPQRSPQRSPLLLPQQQFEDQQQPRGRSPVSSHFLHPQLTPPSSPPQQTEMVPETPLTSPDTVPSTPATAGSSQPTSPETITVTPPPPPSPPPADAAAEGNNNAGAFSQDIQLLIPNTAEMAPPDESISSAKLSDHELDKFPKPKDRSPVSLPVRRKSQRRSQGSIKSVKSVRSPTKAAVKGPLSPAQTRLPSNSRPKRAKSKKSRRRPRAPARQSSMWQLTESAKDLFTIRIFHRIEADEMLPESTLREIRRSRAAHWTRSPELGVTHVDKNKAAAPIEPLSLDDTHDAETGDDVVTPRASVVNQGTDVNRDDCSTPTAPPELLVIGPEAGVNEQVHERELAEEAPLPVQLPDSPTTKSYDGDEEEEALPIMMIVEDESTAQLQAPGAAKLAGSPIPPSMKSPMHRRHPSRQLPPLPTIPEIITTAPEEAIVPPSPAPQPLGSANKVNTEDYVYLDSNPYTLTMPAFRHGQIRLAKADQPIGQLAAAVDDTLDWTAFQMAILGGAGDFFSEPTDYSRPSAAELNELEELTSWFGSFGFQGAGALVGPSEPRTPVETCWTPVVPRTPTLSPPSPTSTPNSSPRTAINGGRSPGIRRIDPPTTNGTKHGDHNIMSFGNGSSNDSIAGRFFPAPSLGPVGPGYSRHRRSASSIAFGQQHPGSQKQQHQNQPMQKPKLHTSSSFEERRNHAGLAIDARRRPSVDSIQSLPQSPMMDLVVSHDVEGNEYVVPMGFNLSHDLGDFLTWHAEHVSGAGFGGGEGGRI